MKKYTQLTLKERVIIAQMRQSKSSITKIASCIGRSKSTISRELKRNEAPPGEYWPDTAMEQSKKRRLRGCIIDRNSALKTFIIDQLTCRKWTPEAISGYLKTQQEVLPYVNPETIYQWIYSPGQAGEKWHTFLPLRKKKRGLRRHTRSAGVDRIKHRISIHERPKSIESNKFFGHWEADLMSCLKNTQFMLVLRERKSMFVKSVVLTDKKASTALVAIGQLLKDLPAKARRSITFDNGGEFAYHHRLQEVLPGIQTFFCDPYASWQKGRVENTNGRLRRDFPRKLNLKAMSKEDFDESIENYNTTPRKGLNWDTPCILFNQSINRVALHS